MTCNSLNSNLPPFDGASEQMHFMASFVESRIIHFITNSNTIRISSAHLESLMARPETDKGGGVLTIQSDHHHTNGAAFS